MEVKMGRVKKLKRKIAILRQRRVKAEEMKRLEIELAGLKREEKARVFAIKHKRKIAVVRGIGMGLKAMAKGIAKGARESEGLKRQYEFMYGKPKRRKVVAVTRKKRKRR